MQQAGTGMDAARIDLSMRIAIAERHAGRVAAGDLAGEIESIRRIALAAGMFPAASVAHALESAIGRGERGPLITGWLSILADAIGSERHDRDACDSYAAACSVRLAG